MLNQTLLEQIDLNKGIDYLTFLSQTITGKIVDFLNSQGYNFSVRWVSLMLVFISLLLIFIAMRVTKPIIKWALLIIGILLILGTVIPW